MAKKTPKTRPPAPKAPEPKRKVTPLSAARARAASKAAGRAAKFGKISGVPITMGGTRGAATKSAARGSGT